LHEKRRLELSKLHNRLIIPTIVIYAYIPSKSFRNGPMLNRIMKKEITIIPISAINAGLHPILKIDNIPPSIEKGPMNKPMIRKSGNGLINSGSGI